MAKFLFGVALGASVALCATPSYADHTECIVQQDKLSMTRPGARYPELHLARLKKGETVSIIDVYRDWVFILATRYQYEIQGNEGVQIPDSAYAVFGWVPRNVLGNCQSKAGTP